MSPTSGAEPVYHDGEPPYVDPARCPDLYALWGELVPDPEDPDDTTDSDSDSAHGAVGYVVAMPDGRTYSIQAEADPWSLGLDGVASHHSPEGAATFYAAMLIRLTPDWRRLN